MKIQGKDIFDVCGNVSRNYRKGQIISTGILSFVLTFALIWSILQEYPAVKYPYIWALLAGLMIMGMGLLVASNIDYSFPSKKEVGNEIWRHGFSESEVNNDFMRAAYYKLRKGIFAAGKTYYVVFAQDLCRVGKIDSITRAGYFSKSVRGHRFYVINYYVRIYESDGTAEDYLCAGKDAAVQLTGKFEEYGITTGTVPAEM